MARVKRALIRRTRKKNLFRRARGFFLCRKNLRQAHQAVMKAESYAYVGRKLRKRDFRRLWTQRINAAARQHGISYSKFIHGLKKSGVNLNRKVLADLAVSEPATFEALATQAKQALSA